MNVVKSRKECISIIIFLFMELWPNFFIVGAMRSGTTSLHAYLKIQPSVYLPDEKEPVYFSTLPGPIPDRQITKQEYLDLFSNVKNEKAIGEASIQYLRDPFSHEKIYEIAPHAKIIIMLRNPIFRAFSQYLAIWSIKKISIGQEIRKDAERVNEKDLENDNPLVYGLYYNQVKRYIDKFGSNQVKVLVYEEFFNDPQQSLKEVLEFLVPTEIKPFDSEKFNEYFTPNNFIWKIITNPIIKKLGYSLLSEEKRISWYKRLRSKNKTKPKLNEDDKKFLTDFYKDDVKSLEKFLNKELPWFK